MLGEHLTFLSSSNILTPVSLRPRLPNTQSALIGQLTHARASMARLHSDLYWFWLSVSFTSTKNLGINYANVLRGDVAWWHKVYWRGVSGTSGAALSAGGRSFCWRWAFKLPRPFLRAQEIVVCNTEGKEKQHNRSVCVQSMECQSSWWSFKEILSLTQINSSLLQVHMTL